MSGILVTGTDTDVGKTWITGALVGILREQGIDAVAYKPVQSGVTFGSSEADSARLKWLGGLEMTEAEICPISLTEPLAPALALRRAGMHASPEQWLLKIKELEQKHQFVFVEGAGGITVPLAENFRVIDLAKGSDLPLLVVAKAGLGTINSILLTLEFAKSCNVPVAGIILNGFGKDGHSLAEETNPELLVQWTDVPILAKVPWLHAETDRMCVLNTVKANVSMENLYFKIGLTPSAFGQVL